MRLTELQAIKYCLDNKNINLFTKNNITQDYFPTAKNEYNYIINHYNSYNTTPTIETMITAFKETGNELLDISSVESADYLIEKLRSELKANTIINYFNSVKDSVLSNRIEDAESLLNQCVDAISNVAQLKEPIDITKDTSRYDRFINKLNNKDEYYVTTGFAELDRLIGGWDRKEEYATIIAKTNYGKSWILMKSALASAQAGLKVGIYSGEMTVDKVAYRIDTLASNISNGGLTHGDPLISKDYKQYLDNINNVIHNSILILHPTMLGHYATVVDLKAFIENYDLDILFIDQFSLLEDYRRAKDRYIISRNITTDIKNLQVMTQKPIVMVCQQTNESSESEFGVDNSLVADCKKITQDCTTVIFLTKKDNILSLYLTKSRDSENNKQLTYDVDINTGKFIYLPNGDDVECNNLESMYDCDDEDVFN